MQIQFRQLGDTCSYSYVKVDVEFFKSYKGHDVYKDADGWFYMFVNGYWNYFDSMCEVRRFVRDLVID